VSTVVAFAAAAAIGALLRAEIGRYGNRPDGFPWGTLAVNVTGAFVLGLLHHIGRPTITVVGVAGLGAYTTFSSFARDAVALVEIRQLAWSATYVLTTVLLGVGAAAVGIAIGGR